MGVSSIGTQKSSFQNSADIETKFKEVDLDGFQEEIGIDQICLVMEFLESDLDRMLKQKIDFSK